MDMVALRKVKLEPSPKPAKKPKKQKSPKPVHSSLFDMEAEDTASNNGKVDTVPVVQLMIPPVETKPNDQDERRRIEDSIKNEVLRTMSDRATRFLQVRGNVLVPESPFAAPTVECADRN